MPRSLWSPIPAGEPLVAGLIAGDRGFTSRRPYGSCDHQLLLTIAGRGVFHGTGDDLVVGAGDAVLLTPGVSHDYGTAPGGRGPAPSWTYRWVHFHAQRDWHPLLDWPVAGPGLLHTRLEPALCARLAARLADLEHLAQSPLARRHALALNALAEVLLWCDAAHPGRGDLARLDPRVRRARDLLCHDLERPLSRRAVVAACGSSASTLSRLFHAQMGMTMLQFREQRRMQRACELLDATSLPVNRVAAAVGFPNPFYFTLRFTAFAKRGPRAYRMRDARTPRT